jgi:ribonuclease VapC
VIIDSSAFIAILRNEPDAERIARAMEQASKRRVSAATLLETAIVVDANRDPLLSRKLDELVQLYQITVEPVTEVHVHLGRAAFRYFGRGSGHPAKLNFGDCFAYALSKATGEPLLFKGDDFSQTDVEPALTNV